MGRGFVGTATLPRKSGPIFKNGISTPAAHKPATLAMPPPRRVKSSSDAVLYDEDEPASLRVETRFMAVSSASRMRAASRPQHFATINCLGRNQSSIRPNVRGKDELVAEAVRTRVRSGCVRSVGGLNVVEVGIGRPVGA